MLTEPSQLFFSDEVSSGISASKNEDHVAFCNDDRKIMFSEFKSDVARYAAFFKRVPENKISLFIQDDMYLFSVLFFALVQAEKHIVLPGSKKQTENTPWLKEIPLLSDCNFSSDFYLIHTPEKLADEKFDFRSMGDEKISFFTSGSTAAPKEITKSIKTLFAEVRNIYNTQHHLISEDVVVVATIQPFHMYGMLWRFLFPLAAGIPIDLNLVISPEDLQYKQSIYKQILFLSVPSLMSRLEKYADLYDFSKGNIKGIFSSGRLLSNETSEGMRKIFSVSPTEIFGSTETGGVAMRQQCNGQQWTVFDPVRVEQDTDGCLKVSSAFIEGGYFKMQDAVQMEDQEEDPRHFILLGRLDRLVKIAEKRVSLPEIEAKYEVHEFIEQAYAVLIAEEKLGALLVLTEKGKEFLKFHSFAEFSMLMRQHMIRFFDNSSVPRKLKISTEIPCNSQGKVRKDEVVSMLESKLPEPIVENAKFSGDAFSADLTFIKDSSYFNGHFPDISILPGVVQMHFAAYFIKKFWRVDVSASSVKRVKFSKIIFPNATVKFSIHRSKQGFAYSFGDNFSSGIFIVDESKRN